jgi:mannosyl-oligosaccharide glucosidase
MQNIVTHAREAIAPYQDPATGPPDPSFTLQLNDEVLSGSNLYAVQKIFSGAFSFDVLFESASAGKPLDGMSSARVTLYPVNIRML